MKKCEDRRCIFVKVRGETRRVFVSDLKAIIMRKKPTGRPPVPSFTPPIPFPSDESDISLSQEPIVRGITV